MIERNINNERTIKFLPDQVEKFYDVCLKIYNSYTYLYTPINEFLVAFTFARSHN